MADTAAAPKRAADRIRETARDLFYRQGIRAVGVDQIVTEAGVTKPSLYRAFGSPGWSAITRWKRSKKSRL